MGIAFTMMLLSAGGQPAVLPPAPPAHGVVVGRVLPAAPAVRACSFCTDCACKAGTCPSQCPVIQSAPAAAPKPTYRVEYFTSRGQTYFRLVPECVGGSCPAPRK